MTANVQIAYSWSGADDQFASTVIRENGDEVDVDVTSANDAGLGNDIVFLVDTSAGTDANHAR